MSLSGIRVWAGVVVFSCLCSLTAAAPASAQTPQTNVSGGYQYLNAQDFNLNGWYADVSVPFTKLMSFVGDAGGSYYSQSLSVLDASARISLKFHTFMGGVRVAKRAQSILVPFGQALVGAAVTTGTAQINGGGFLEELVGVPLDVSETVANVALQLGGGIDIMVHPKVGVRIGASYLRIFVNDGGFNGFRFVAGAVIPLGSK